MDVKYTASTAAVFFDHVKQLEQELNILTHTYPELDIPSYPLLEKLTPRDLVNIRLIVAKRKPVPQRPAKSYDQDMYTQISQQELDKELDEEFAGENHNQQRLPESNQTDNTANKHHVTQFLDVEAISSRESYTMEALSKTLENETFPLDTYRLYFETAEDRQVKINECLRRFMSDTSTGVASQQDSFENIVTDMDNFKTRE